jgi:hypothetical protein
VLPNSRARSTPPWVGGCKSFGLFAARTARLVRSQKGEIKYKKPTAARWRSAANHGGIASNLNRLESLQRNPDRCSRTRQARQGGGGSNCLQSLGRVTARGSRRDFFWPETFDFFSRNQRIQTGLRLPQGRRPSICKGLDSCSALGPRSGSPSPRNYLPAAGAGGAGRISVASRPEPRGRHAFISAKFGKLFFAASGRCSLERLVQCRLGSPARSKKTPRNWGWGGSWTLTERMR